MELRQGGFLVALASMPMMLEAACRWRVVMPGEIKAVRRSWGRLRALLVIDPLEMPSTTNLEGVTRSFPELLKP